jgi:DNA recombination-dependent growth factor C
MSLGAGALALRRVQILVSPKDVRFTDIVKKLKSKAISPLALEDEREQSSGWCHPYTGEPHFDSAHEHLYGQAFVFGLRSDVKRIPGTYFRLQMKNALDALQGKEKGQGRAQGKKVKDALRDRIKLELLRGTLPTVKLTEVVWHLDNNELWILSSSQSVYEEIEQLFLETFGWALAVYNPGLMGVDLNRMLHGVNVSLDNNLNLVPADFRGPSEDQARIRSAGKVLAEADLF